MLKNRFQLILIFLLVFQALPGHAKDGTSSYPQGKIWVDNGNLVDWVKGKNLLITPEMASIEVKGVVQSYDLLEVKQIMVKQGKGRRYGMISAGVSVGIVLIWAIEEIIGVNEVDSAGDGFATGLAVVYYAALGSGLGGMSYGAGWVAGSILDEWQLVYESPNIPSPQP